LGLSSGDEFAVSAMIGAFHGLDVAMCAVQFLELVVVVERVYVGRALLED